ncbi:cytochrome C' [Bacillus glycinifermentans]|uniref:Cytochrome C n=1 Tax=Bacillus glycinifermentans TaxID=1664069 RepID=A0A0J6HWY6_9BACI|nr:cytochrome c [Bacillus glycinifermentans]ATH93423.1 cytochrome C' [Bacillus glycinifermentans]KMM63487.1 cytochrome C' [Bacillus glycinifermentans]KRT90412.1 cytochrome C' [Bacillus glycinifermentans]MEC0484116.1 cytochrome c [Bacillus glycinifermentans]MEC0494230.1 cytochrome c [Bacillus glycinifermentans]
MKTKLFTLFLAVSFVLAACGGNNESKDKNTSGQTTANDGEEIYQQNCTGCHGKDLAGGSAPGLKEVGGKLKESEIKDIVVNGRGGMPGGLVKEDQAEAVAKWLSQKK